MKKHELEAKTLAIIDRVIKGQKIEDSTVELKARWLTEHDKAARQIAAHANAARGEPIHWVIGVDEDAKTVVGVDPDELSNWLSSMSSFFQDRVVPDLLLSVPVAIEQKTVIALFFGTDRPPYVVKNPSFGKSGGGPVEYEVPWREGVSTRTARRADLLRLLVPIAKRPEIEVLKAEMKYTRHQDGKEKWRLETDFYVIPAPNAPVAFPMHKMSSEFSCVDGETMLPLHTTGRIADKPEGYVTHEQVKASGPMGFTLFGDHIRPVEMRHQPEKILVLLNVIIAGDESVPLSFRLELGDLKQHEDGALTWEHGELHRHKKKFFVA